MRVLQINSFGNLSTGKIAADIQRVLTERGHEGCLAFARNSAAGDVASMRIGSRGDVLLHGALSRLTDRTGFYSTRATRRFLRAVDEYDPDVIHLHNLHGYYINIDLLFRYLKERRKPVVWTLHDCWAFTGHCCYYSTAGCDRWQSGCHDCPNRREYPASLRMDRSRDNYRRKRALFTGIEEMRLVPVSRWLDGEVGRSFLRDYPREVIFNGIDLQAFQPTRSDFRRTHGLEGKQIILGVASTWSERKGLADFLQLSRMLDANQHIVLVGLNEKQRRGLPENVTGLGRTDGLHALAEIYTAADVFLNASVEETFGLPTVEAMACGTTAVVYDQTALPEVIADGCGAVVRAHDLRQVLDCIKRVPMGETNQAAIRQARRYDKRSQFQRYVEIYEELCPDGAGREGERCGC